VPELLIIYLLFFRSVEFVTRIGTAFGYAGLAESGLCIRHRRHRHRRHLGRLFATEVIRGALAAIPQGHIEAARALGMPRAHLPPYHRAADAAHRYAPASTMSGRPRSRTPRWFRSSACKS
jgi:hypothetical protein